MEIKFIQTITNILDENHQIINSTITESCMIYPAQGKAIKNLRTNEIFEHALNIGSKGKLKDFVEIDIDE